MMNFRGFLLLFAVVIKTVSVFCEEANLWIIEQDFVKFGKKEIYEKYKKELLENGRSEFPAFVAQDDESSQYIYLIPIKDDQAFNRFIQKRLEALSISPEVRIPFVSSLNFSVDSLHRYLANCSYVPNKKEGYRNVYFYIFGILPGNEGIFETQLQKIAKEQARGEGVCFRSWKVLMGSDVPKYLVVVFAQSEKLAKKRAESLEFIPMKNLLRSQKEGAAILRRDLSGQDLDE